MTGMVIGFTVGCAVVAWSPQVPPMFGAILLAAAGLYLISRKNPWRIVGSLFVGVALTAGSAERWVQQRAAAEQLTADVRVLGTVEGIPRHHGGFVSFDFHLDRASARALGISRVRLSWFRSGAEVKGGQRWDLVVGLRVPRSHRNVGGPNRARSALLQRLAAEGTVRRGDRLRSSRGIGASRDRARERIAAEIGARLARHDAGADLVRALGVGDRGTLSRSLSEALRATGTSHLLAVSGLHVALAAGVGFVLARLVALVLPGLLLRLPLAAWDTIVAMFLAAGYATLTGFALPAQRALIMVCAFGAGRIFGISVSGSTRLSIAIVALLVVDPLSVLDGGFWLSCGAVAILLAWSRGHGRRGWKGVPLMQVTLIALMWPLTGALFGHVSLAAPLVNLVAVPWVSISIMPLVILGVAAALLDESIGCWILSAAAWQLQHLASGIEWVAGLPMVTTQVGRASPLLGVAAVAATLLWLLPPGLRRLTPGMLLLATFLINGAPRVATGQVRLHVLDLGAGSSALIRTADHTLLFDAGYRSRAGPDQAETIVIPVLRAGGVKRLDALVLSGTSRYHSGGAEAVIKRLRPSRTWAPSDFAGVSSAGGCRTGLSWRWDDVTFTFVHPSAHLPASPTVGGCVLAVAVSGYRLLLAGDLSKAAVARLDLEREPYDVVIAPNHGRVDPSALVARGGIVVLTPPHRGSIEADFRCARSRQCSVVSTSEGGMFTLDAPMNTGETDPTTGAFPRPFWWQS